MQKRFDHFEFIKNQKNKTNEMLPSKYERLNDVCVPAIRGAQSETGKNCIFHYFIEEPKFVFHPYRLDLYRKCKMIFQVFFVVVVEKFDRWWQNTISTISNQQFPLKLNTCFFFYFRYMARREKEVQREKRSIVVEQIKFVYRQRKKCGADRNIVTMLHDTMHRRRKKNVF